MKVTGDIFYILNGAALQYVPFHDTESAIIKVNIQVGRIRFP